MTTDVIGIVGFSFALRGADNEPNPCNARLARVIEQIASHHSRESVVVAQWEIAKQLVADGCEPAIAVDMPGPDGYLGSEEVWASASRFFRMNKITRVTPVAQPFLQMRKVKKMIKADGFEVLEERVPRIGFDPSRQNLQWWTKGPVRLVLYAIRQAVKPRHAHESAAPTVQP